MMTVIFSLMTVLLMAAGVFMVFSGNASSVLRQHYSYQVRSNTINACMVYGDLLTRAHVIDAVPSTSIPDKVTVTVGCLAQRGTTCSEPINCVIQVKTDNKIYVTTDR